MTFKMTALSCLLVFASADYIGVPIPSLKRPSIKGEFPYHVSLTLLSRYGQKQSHFCSGSIVADQWILTSGHCAEAAPYDGHIIVLAGLRRSNTRSYNQSIDVKEVFLHHDYSLGLGFDFALLKLKSKLQINELVAPVSLPHNDKQYRGKAILTGWGVNSGNSLVLQTEEVRFVQNHICNDSINARAHDLSPLRNVNLCTESLTSLPTCIGDSGSPLVQRDTYKYELAGVYSWTVLPCGQNGYNSVYSKVFEVTGWIDDVIRINK